MAIAASQKNVRAQTTKKQQVQSHSGTGRSWTESVIATVVHFIFFLCYIAIIIYDAYMQKNCPNPQKYFPGLSTYGGRGKYMTYITMVRSCDNHMIYTSCDPNQCSLFFSSMS